ncbi:MAG: hypothetical protein ABJP45_01315 [Cyclobacteriaceae bacterium]
MKKTRFRQLFIILIAVPCLSFSQEKYISFEEIEFDSPLQRKVLKEISDGEGTEVFDAFLVIATEDSSSFEKWKVFYEKEMEVLKNRKPQKKLAKDVKNIYDNLHEKFLRKYEYVAYFDQIFENGVYNCVTAVALYAMSFERLGISYSIKETPTHVYIVADPEDSQLLIETTDPVSGFKTFSPGFKENYVAQLAMMKLVDQSDVSDKGLYTLFDEFYFGGADLSLKQLVGIQFYNLGVSALENNDYYSAWRALSKAQLFHSTDQIDRLLFVSIANVLSGSDYANWEDVKLLPYLHRFEEFDVKKTNVVGEFARMLNFVLVNNNDTEKAEKAFDYFVTNTTSDELIKEVTFLYNYERSRLAYNRANYKESFEFITKGYEAKPGNADAEALLTGSFQMAYVNKSTTEALSTLDTLMTQNEELEKNNHFNTMRMNLYLSKMGEDFDNRKSTSGTRLKELFEKTIAENPDYLYDRNILSNAYSKAAVYYFKRGYTTKARGIIQSGLELVPDSYELKSRLRMISR